MNILARLWRWRRRKRSEEHHTDALHAEARAIEDLGKAKRDLPEILVMKAHFRHLNENNHFGQRLEIALGKRKK